MTESAHEASDGTTADERVDAALQLLDVVDDQPVGQHAAVYDEIHRRLQDALATLDRE